MDYSSLIEKIFRCYPMYHKVGSGAYKAGFENIESLLAAIGNPEKRISTIHVGGTNGKGSTAHLLASFCKENGLKTGLFTSPHLIDFRERIRIDGTYISEKEVVDFFGRYKKLIADIEPSFFEITTAIAFDHFARKNVDMAVIEVGLGGRLDSTNVISPKLSVITNISLEHTALLGNTIAEIAFEKAGIIKNNIPVVIGEYNTESFPVFKSVAAEKNAPLTLAEEFYSAKFTDNTTNMHGRRPIDISRGGETLFTGIMSPMCGKYQEKNIATFTAAAMQLSEAKGFTSDKIKPAIENLQKNFTLIGRWQIVSEQPLTICDTGHNQGCFTETMAQLKSLEYNKLHFIIGFVNDKNTEQIFPLMPSEAVYYVCAASVERATPSEKLTTQMRQYGFTDVADCGSVTEAFETASRAAITGDVIFIGGSTFVVADFLKTS